MLDRFLSEALLVSALVATPKTLERYQATFASIRNLFVRNVRREKMLARLQSLLRRDIRWRIAANGGGSMEKVLEPIFEIAGRCSATELRDTFPLGLIDEWIARSGHPPHKAELRMWSEEFSKTIGDENLSLLRANLGGRNDERAQWIANAFSASGVEGALSAVDEPVPFKFARYTEVEDGPRVCVLMSVRNSEKTVERAAQSVLDQTWKNLSLVITDDASTDGTVARIMALKEKDPRVTVRLNERNCGPYISRNGAVRESDSEFVTCHDADDIAHPRKIAVQMQSFLGKPGAASNLSQWIRVRDNGRVMPLHLRGFVHDNFSSLLVRREIFEAIGYWDSVRTTADSEFRERIRHRFGAAAEHSIRPILAIGQFASSTLTGHPVTGASWLHFSDARMQYLRAYRKWHQSAPPDALYVPFPLEARPFEVPAEL